MPKKPVMVSYLPPPRNNAKRISQVGARKRQSYPLHSQIVDENEDAILNDTQSEEGIKDANPVGFAETS